MYKERLTRLGLFSLEFRRMRGNLIETHKPLTGLDRVDAGRIFPMVGESRTRGHSLRIQGWPFRMEVRRHFFTQRVVSLWNSLPQETLNVFKRQLDIALGANGIKGYGEKVGLGYWVEWSALIIINGGAGSMGQMASSFSYLLCFYVCFYELIFTCPPICMF